MSRVRFYIQPDEISNIIEIKDRETIHKIKNILRLRQGETIGIFDGGGKEYSYNLDETRHSAIYLTKNKLERHEECQKNKIILGFPLVKEEKADFILQKATELGVSEFIPFYCEHSINVAPSAAKILRWKKIIEEATRQSERLWLPALRNINTFNELCKNNFEVKLAALSKGGNIKDFIAVNAQEIFVAVGPEGDFSKRECELFKKSGFKFIRLCENILRVETAGIFAAGLLNYFLNTDYND
ncbi:MAG: RsmE family RNA methyltransferase [Candidatus Omnitrophota bacterium]|nr:RsmE family RNA methyltransferase [Candidatus Omnitrophota bacterium]